MSMKRAFPQNSELSIESPPESACVCLCKYSNNKSLCFSAFEGIYSAFAIQWLQSPLLTLCAGFWPWLHPGKEMPLAHGAPSFWAKPSASTEQLPAGLLFPFLCKMGGPVDTAGLIHTSSRKNRELGARVWWYCFSDLVFMVASQTVGSALQTTVLE